MAGDLIPLLLISWQMGRPIVGTVAAVAMVSCLLASAAPAHAASMPGRVGYVPCADARTDAQRLACQDIRERARQIGLTGQDTAPDGEPASCQGDAHALRKSKYLVLYEYWGEMYVGCNYPVDLCSVSMWSSTTVPQYLFGHGILDPSYYCQAKTLVSAIGTAFNFTFTIGSCLSNGTFWVEDDPEERLW